MAGDTQAPASQSAEWVPARERESKGAANNRERAHTGNTLPPRLIASSKHGQPVDIVIYEADKKIAPRPQAIFIIFCKS